MKCRHKGCRKQHKSYTGFCVLHAADIDKPVTTWLHAGRPQLYEEVLDNATTPKVTIK